MLTKSFLKTDVTSVKFYNDLVLVGIGSDLHIFDKYSRQLLQTIVLLIGQKIHGITTKSKHKHVVIYGGKQFNVVKIIPACNLGNKSQLEIHKLLDKPITCNDWIQHIIWNKTKLALLTAHNVVQIWCAEKFQLIESYETDERSILYSGLLYELNDDLLVFAGTVFSQVLLYTCMNKKTIQALTGHKGVIFSITWNENLGLIATTSDDRSVRLWKSQSVSEFETTAAKFWENSKFACTHILYGHLARVMNCCISSNTIVSAGEDSFVCFWSLSGELIRKTKCHQDSCIWSIDCDEETNVVVTGGSDAAVFSQPLAITSDAITCTNLELGIEFGIVKHMNFTAQGNIVLLCDNNCFIYFNFTQSSVEEKFELNHTSSYNFLSLSSCKQLIAVIDQNGNFDLFVENCRNTPKLRHILSQNIGITDIISMHWTDNRHLILCNTSGELIVFTSHNGQCVQIDNFKLPTSKGHALTSVYADGKYFVVSDRSGSVHIYETSKRNALESLLQVHGYYGATSISLKDNQIITTGRDGKLKFHQFDLSNNHKQLKYLHEIILPFRWIERFIYKSQTLICGFKEKNFIVYNLVENRIIAKVFCGGGHRSWDVMRTWIKSENNFNECIKFIFGKRSNLKLVTIHLEKMKSSAIISGTQAREINCLELCGTKLISNSGKPITIFITGGEDTTVRISSCHTERSGETFKDIGLYRHLSNVRAICVRCISSSQSRKELLIMSGGGRAQICVHRAILQIVDDAVKVQFEDVIRFMLKGTDKERKGKKPWRETSLDLGSETRIMDIFAIDSDVYDKIDKGTFFIQAGCSDSFLRLFKLTVNDKDENEIKTIANLSYHKLCILKVFSFNKVNKLITMSMSTNGVVAFWDFTSIVSSSSEKFNDLVPIGSLQTNKSGINSFSVQHLTKSELLLATGGDDNTIHLVLIDFGKESELKFHIKTRCEYSTWHAAQITGLGFIDDCYIISVSIDQRITLSQWSCSNDKVDCVMLIQHYTNVSDVQGVRLETKNRNFISLCVYGKGLEILHIMCPIKEMPINIEQVAPCVLLGEGPHWDAEQQCLYYVSIFDFTVHKYVPSTRIETRTKLAGNVGFIVPISGTANKFVAGINREVVLFEWDGQDNSPVKVLKIIAEVDEDTPTNRLNDGKADPKGRLFAGTMGKESPPGVFERKKGNLFRFDSNGTTKCLDKLGISNGLCWDENHNAMYFIDSLEYKVVQYDYDFTSGQMSNPKIAFDFQKYNLEGIPDGMTIDTDGNLWVAVFNGSKVIKIEPSSGTLLQTVDIPALQITSVAFGGKDLDELYVTSASMNIKGEQLPPCGALFKVSGLGVKGFPGDGFKL